MTKTIPITAHIREERRQRGLSQSQLAAMIGAHYTTICALERGKIRRPSAKTRKGLERVLGIRIPRYLW